MEEADTSLAYSKPKFPDDADSKPKLPADADTISLTVRELVNIAEAETFGVRTSTALTSVVATNLGATRSEVIVCAVVSATDTIESTQSA